MSELTRPRPRRPGLFYRVMMGFLGLFDRWLHLSCRSFVRTASEKHERPLRLGERLRQMMHRAMCRICRVQERRMDQLRDLAQEIGRTAVDEIDVELTPEATERMRQAMEQAASQRPSGRRDPD
jgi:hypothetical protein